ncbi:unnamed protein product [Tuber aestivum]|uniref:Zn(2)-C6 fungal-type domain-containing protein n=1 Tax=Tuber aestivum TaxID=59557 RepID=A0A292PTA2_9PEZI|nr:unnamed protein product [Tuber aestivum]
MPPKRRHTKSRNGCMTCRRRRVKCDEIRPICTNCTRRELDCMYAAYCPPGRPGISCARSSPSASSSSSPSSTCPPSQAVVPRPRALPLLLQCQTPASTKPRKSGSTSSSVVDPLTALAKQLDSILLGTQSKTPSPLPRISLSRKDLDNLSLLHHFTIETHRSLTNEGAVEVFRTKLPRIALQNELTMHALLAVTALHLSSTLEAPLAASRYQIIAAGHYDRALSSLRTAILERSQNGDAIFAASTMIAVHGIACQVSPSESNHVPRVVNWIPLLKGVYAILQEWGERVSQGELGPVIHQGATKPIEDGDFLTLPASLLDLALETPPTSSVAHDSDDGEVVDAVAAKVYRDVLGLLRVVWNHFWTTGHSIATSIQFLVLLPEEYIHYLRQDRPRALVIFCYFLCTLKKLDGYWWIKGSAQETFVKMERKLNIRWRERWLKWPKGIIMGDCEVIEEGPL